MAEVEPVTAPEAPAAPEKVDWAAEVARLNKVVKVLMDRVERSASMQGSEYNLFQATIMLEAQVRRRTVELEAALKEIESVNRALRESEAKYRAVVSQSVVGIVLIEDGKFSHSNAKFDEMMGYSAEEIRALGPMDLAIQSERAVVATGMRLLLSGKAPRFDRVVRSMRKDGEVIDTEIHGSLMSSGGKQTLLALILDVTQRTRAEREVRDLQESLREQSIHDALTGLYNRHYLDANLGPTLAAARQSGCPVSVILGDIDHFKAINDGHGHLAGDAVLRAFGAMMKRHARSADLYCRYGGEEFLLVLPGMAQDRAVERAEQLRASLAATPIEFGLAHIAVTASFGVATFPRDGESDDALIAAADRAMYAAKEAGRNRVNVSSPR